jgi:hypothetical protein
MSFAIPKRLNNGAEIKALKMIVGHHMMVLAFWEGDLRPWVTWAVDSNGDAYWGHYFVTEAEAYDDWEKRSL